MNKKIFTIMIIFIVICSLSFVSASDNNDTVLSVSESNNMISISSNNVSYHSDNDDVIGNSVESDDVLSDGEVATKIHVTPSKEGIIEDDSVVLEITLTDENDNPMETGNLLFYINGVVADDGYIENGVDYYTLKRTSGFYYFYCEYTGHDQYAESRSNTVEIIFANDNTMTELAVRMILADGELNLTKDFVGYGENSVTRRYGDNYSQILVEYNKLNEGIPLSKTLTINGNGHKINASGDYPSRCFFIVNEGTFTLNDLILSNGYSIVSANFLFTYRNQPTINLNNVTFKDSFSFSNFFGGVIGSSYGQLKLNVINSIFLNNEIFRQGNYCPGIFSVDLSDSTIENSVFINNTDIFSISFWADIIIRNNLFIDNDRIVSLYPSKPPIWYGGTISGNYFGTNDTSVINNLFPEFGEDVEYTMDTQTYLSIDGNRTFSEDDIQEYDIYFTGDVPAYETVISYTSNHSTINTTAINISSTKTTVRVSPKGYGIETLVVEPNLYVMPINITKSTKINYNVEVDAPETQYSIPLVITVNVKDEDNNTVTTTANVTIDGTTKTININDGVGTLTVNDLIPGKYDITTKIISNRNNYRNTTIYSSTNITTANAVITLSLNTTESIAREKVAFTIKTQNVIGNDISTTVYLVEDGVEVGSTDTDSNGNAIYYYAPEAGTHTYTVRTHNEEYWKSAESNQVDLYVTTKKPTKLTISSDIDMITDPNQKATITSRLTDEDDNPLRGVEVDLVANDIVVDTKTTDDNGECEFEFTSTSNLYHVKIVYNGNLTYYDNSSDVLDIIVSTGGAFFDLSILINATEENDVLTLVRNFTFDENLDQDFVNGIPINKNIIIDGKGYTVDALSKARIFNINANNVTLDNLNLINALTPEDGAAIYFDGDLLTVSNSEFKNNTVKKDQFVEFPHYHGGGAIYSIGVLNVINSSFTENKAIFYNNISDTTSDFSGGGAIYAKNDLSIYNSNFDSNIAKTINVSDIELITHGSSIISMGEKVLIKNSTFKNNVAYYAAISYPRNYRGNFSIYDSLFVNNTANHAAALNVAPATGEIINTTFENNHAKDIGVVTVSTNGGFLFKDCNFLNNSANGYGGALSLGPGSFTVENSLFINNYAGNGGAIHFLSSGFVLTLRYDIFVNNSADNASCLYFLLDDSDDLAPVINYNYWGNNTPYGTDVINDVVSKDYDYITLEIIGENVTYTTIPTEYIIKFNGTNADKLSDFETLIDALAKSNVNLDKDSIVINSTGAKVTLTSDEVQNITLVVGQEYNILAYFNITVKQLIKKNYTSNITFSGDSYGSTLIATLDIFDENGNQTGINGPLTYTFNGKTRNTTVENGKVLIILGRNDAGEYNFTFTFNSTNLLYNNLDGNKSLNISKVNMTFTLDVNNATYGEDINITATPQRGVSGNFTFYIENELNQTVRISAGNAIYSLNDLAAGNYTLIATYNGNKNYDPLSISRNFTVSKASSKVVISIDDANYGDKIIAFVTGENIMGNVTITVNSKNYNVEIKYNAGNVTIDKLNAGKYDASVVYAGNSNIIGSNNATQFEVFKASSNMAVDIGESVLGHDTAVTVKFSEGVEGNVKVTVDGKDYDLPIKNGIATLNLTDLAEGNHTVNVKYPGSDNYNSSQFNSTFTTKSLKAQFNVTSSNIVYGKDLIVKANVNSDATGNVEFSINNMTKTATIKDGVAEATFEGLNAGTYLITAKYSGDSTYISSTNTTNVKVSKAKSYVFIDVSQIIEGETVTIKFTVPSDATGTITVEIPGLYTPRNRTLTDGVNTWTLTSLKSGNYTLNVVYNGDKNYLSSSNSTVLVSKYHPALNIDISDAFVGDDYTIKVSLNDTATGSVLITVDGVEYKKTLSKGKASVTLKNLAEGNHTVVVTYSGDDNFYNATASKSFAPKSLVSSINVTAKNIVYGSDLIVKAVVTSGATGNVEFSVNGVTKSAVIKNGVAQTTFTNLDAGNYRVIAKYFGDHDYASSTNTTSVKVSKAKSHVSIDVGEIKDGKNVVIKFNVSIDATGTITVEIPGLYSSRNRTLTNGANTWTISPLKPGTYTLNVIYNGNKNYMASSNSAVLIAKDYPVINIDVSESVVGRNAVIDVELPGNATGSVLITVDGIKYNRTLSNGKASITLLNVTKGTHKVDVLYSGDKYYYSSENSTSFEPKQMYSHIYLLASDVEFGKDLVVRAVVESDATGTVMFTVNGITKAVQVHQGFAAATYSNLNASTYNIKAAYSGNDVYSSSSNTTRANVLKANSTVSIKVGEIKEGENVRITIIVSKSATGNITVEIPGLYSQRVRQLSNNQNIWLIAPLSAGLYEVKVAYPGDNNYYGSSNSTFIDYNRVKTTLNVDAIPSKNNVRLVANLTAEDGQLITAWVNVDVNGIAYRIPVFNGTGYLDLGKLEGGDYRFEAFYAGTRAIINSTDEGSFTVVPVIPILNIPDVIKYYGGSERLYVYLKDNYNDPIANASVVITINGQDYERKTNANGSASIALNLNSGVFETTVVCEQYNLTTIAKVTVLPTVNGTDVVKVYRNATQYYATFRDSNGNYLKEGTMVKFNINGVFYERKISGDKGMAKLNLNLEQGNYILTAMNPVTGENGVNNITVISRIIENYDVTKYFRNGTQYTVKILGDDGEPVGAGETITFNINGVMYTRTTNASGIAKLNINLNPGTYIITGEYAGCRVSNTIKVLPILTAKDLAKKYGTSNPFVAKLVDGHGNPYAGQTITFNINGVFYNRVTDNAGQARLNINLQAGQYIITSSYNAANLSNKVTITP